MSISAGSQGSTDKTPTLKLSQDDSPQGDMGEILTEEKSQFQFYNNQYANRRTQSEAQDDLSSSLMKIVGENINWQGSSSETKTQKPQPTAFLPTDQNGTLPFEVSSLFNFIAITTGGASAIGHNFRPANLPPQSREEAKRVQLMVERDRQEYLKKKKEKQVQQLKKEQEQKVKLAKINQIVKVWTTEIFPNWDNVKRTKRVREMWIDELPEEIRGKVWYLAFGNRSAITRNLYEIMADRGATLQSLFQQQSLLEQQLIESGFTEYNLAKLENQDIHTTPNQQNNPTLVKLLKIRRKLSMLIPTNSQSQTKERSILIIDADVPRTFAHLDQIQTVERQQLAKILQAFTMYRPDIGYVQGMSYVAAMLLIHTKDEFMTFVIFCTLMTKYPILPFFNFNDVLIRKIMQLYKQVFAYNLPELCEHFELEGIMPQKYIYEWFMTLFTRIFKDIRLTRRIWDFYFLDGIFVLFQTAIALLRALSEVSPGLWGEMDEILPSLQNIGSEIQTKIGPIEEVEQLLIKYMYDVSFPKWVYDEIPLLESEFFRQDLNFN